ncbi:MAG: hypothetical protein V1708_02920, partial [Candidatus Micrarchaeota archaeon]
VFPYNYLTEYSFVCGVIGLQESGKDVKPRPVPTETPDVPPLPDDGMPYEFTVKLMPGWNLFSTPVYYQSSDKCSASKPCPLVAFPPTWKVKENTCSDLNIWHYNVYEKKYEFKTLVDMQHVFNYVDPSDGFWAKSKKACSITFEGDSRYNGLIGQHTLPAGWNQKSFGLESTGAAGMLSSCKVSSGPWYYDNPSGKWVKVTNFEPGKGYFIKLASQCSFSLLPAPTPTSIPAPSQQLCESTGGDWLPKCLPGTPCPAVQPYCRCQTNKVWDIIKGCIPKPLLIECSKDSDCASAGCSGQLCVPKSKADDTITTCEYNTQWACLKETSCGCTAGKCKWDTANSYYQSCLAVLRNMPSPTPSNNTLN